MAKIVVLGAGMCGLAAGLLLRRDGHDVTVLERDPERTPDSLERADPPRLPGPDRDQLLALLDATPATA